MNVFLVVLTDINYVNGSEPSNSNLGVFSTRLLAQEKIHNVLNSYTDTPEVLHPIQMFETPEGSGWGEYGLNLDTGVPIKDEEEECETSKLIFCSIEEVELDKM